MRGHIHSTQTLGTVDGPGVRFVLFMQGCPLRCGCCHNPDTWAVGTGKEADAEQIFHQVERYRAYFGKDGGLTVSGGEPLLQPAFVRELFTLCRKAGIHTALDTSGCLWNEEIEGLLHVTDLCLLDHKMPTDEAYRAHVGCGIDAPEHFLARLQHLRIPTWLRRVIIPGINDSIAQTKQLYALRERFSCVERIELLPFRKLCVTKYEAMGIPFPFRDIPPATSEQINTLLAACEP